MSVKLNIARIQKKIDQATNKAEKKLRSQIANEMNKEIRSLRKEIVEFLMPKTKLKRKAFNDRLSITRANPKLENLTVRLSALFGRNIYMTDYPWEHVVARGKRTVIRLLSPIYRKNTRTAFMSKDKSRMYIRFDSDDGKGKVRALRGRSIPRLFKEFDVKKRFNAIGKQRVIQAIRRIVKGA